MKKINFILLFLFACISLHTAAQSNIWVNGYTYTEEAGKQIMIPFATISIYDYGQEDQLRYFTVSGPFGNYHIKPYDYKKQYHFVVEAPGYKTRSFNMKEVPETMNGKPFSGNTTVSIRMEKDPSQSTVSVEPKKYTKEELEKENGLKSKSLPELLCTLPEIRKEGDEWITADGEGSVCLFLNGTIVAPEVLPALNELPTNTVSSFEYYQLPNGSVYNAVLNIVLSAGQKATAPTYKLMQSSLIF